MVVLVPGKLDEASGGFRRKIGFCATATIVRLRNVTSRMSMSSDKKLNTFGDWIVNTFHAGNGLNYKLNIL